MEELRKPVKGAGPRLREFYKHLRKQPMSPELKETLNKKDRPTKEDSKEIATADHDVELS